jgi:hypothetical protein
MPQRRFSPPWRAEEHDTCFIVRDGAGLNLAYVYFQNEPSCRSAAKLLSRAEARRIAIKIASLPEFSLAKINHAASSRKD